jgi:YD repeat-containing protein
MKHRPTSHFSRLLLIALSLRALTSDAGTINYTYDPAGRLIGVDYGTNRTVSLAYDNAGNLLQSSQPSPGLQIGAVVGNQFTLAWPAAPAGFTLEASPTVGPGANWTNVNLTATLNGNLLTVTVPVSGVTQFYRLRKP